MTDEEVDRFVCSLPDGVKRCLRLYWVHPRSGPALLARGVPVGLGADMRRLGLVTIESLTIDYDWASLTELGERAHERARAFALALAAAHGKETYE